MARRNQLVEVMLVAMLLVGTAPREGRAQVRAEQRRATLPVAVWMQSTPYSDKVNELLFGATPTARRLRVFVRGMSVLAGGSRAGSSHRDCRVDGVCRQLGELLLRRQALELDGRRQELADFLKQLRQARSDRVPEAQVRAMVREALAGGELRPNADAECRALQRRVDDLNRQLALSSTPVGGEVGEMLQVSARR